MGITVSIPDALAYGEDGPLPATQPAPDVLVAVSNMLKGRVGYVARRLGWSESTLQKKISGREKHVFSVRDLQLVQHVLGDVSPTQFLAAAEGYVCLQLKPVQVDSLEVGLVRLQVALADFAQAAHAASKGGGAVSANGLRSVRHFEAEVLGCVNAVGAFIASRAVVPQEEGGDV